MLDTPGRGCLYVNRGGFNFPISTLIGAFLGYRVMSLIKERAAGDNSIQVLPLARAVGQTKDRFGAIAKALGLPIATKGKIEKKFPEERSGGTSEIQGREKNG